MAIYKIDDVRINGKNQAFGGYIYAVDAQMGLAENPTRITVNFLNESGSYLEPDLSVDKPYRIKIGNILEGSFYAVTRTFKKSSGGRTLEVEFVDGSIILDRLYVGLYKRMGDDKTNVDGLIIVGREIHPCDVDENGVFDQKDANELLWNGDDPCELRCPSDYKQREPVVENCLKKEITDIFDVKYNFKELLAAIQGKVAKLPNRSTISFPIQGEKGETIQVPLQLPQININTNSNTFNRVKVIGSPANFNEFYVASYSGPLREVLKSWCADFGWTFYWENDGLNFIDTQERPKISSTAFANLESLTDKRSIEGTVARGFVSHYAHAGIEAEIDCSQSRPYILRCLTLSDLFGEFYKPAWNAIALSQTDFASTSETILDPPIPDPTDANNRDNQIEYIDDFYKDGVPIASFEKSCVLAYYSDTLRHLYNLWEYYGLYTAALADTARGKWMDRLGQMKFINVFHKGSATSSKTKYDTLMSGTFGESKEKLVSQDEASQITVAGGYFVVVLRNRIQPKNDLLDLQFEREEDLATNYMGRHWYRSYIAPYMGETPQITPNGQYFGALSTNVKDIPFANFGHTYKSPISKMVSSFIQRQSNNFRQYGRLRFAQNFAKNISKKLVRSILYTQKETQDRWVPLKNAETSLNSTITDAQKKMFKRVNIDELSIKGKRALVTDDNGKIQVADEFLPYVELYVMYPGRLSMSSRIGDNPVEELPSHEEGLEPASLATAGLLSKKCAIYSFNGASVYTPAGASVLFQRQVSFQWLAREHTAAEFSTPTYKIWVTNNNKNRGIIKKTEAIFIEAPQLANTMKTEFQVKELNRDSTKFLNKLGSECTIPTNELLSIHGKVSKNLNFSINEPFRSVNYRIMGLKVPSSLSIKSGLESLSVTVDSKGVFTDITIGNSLFTPPSPDVITKALENNISAEVINTRKNPL